MPTRTSLQLTTVVLAFLPALLLGGCSATPAQPAADAAISAGPTPNVDRDAQQVASAIARSRNGAKITADQAAALRGTSKTHSAYQLKSGDWVITDRSKPLPGAVQKDMNSRAVLTLRSNGGIALDTSGRQGTSSTIQQLSGDDSAQRTVVSLVRGSSFVEAANSYERVWLLNGLGGNGEVVSSEAVGLAKANAFIKAQDNPTSYTIVIAKS